MPSLDYTEEVWTAIPGYEGFYEISNLDRVRSVARMVRVRGGGLRRSKAKIKKGFVTKGEYISYGLWKEGKERVLYLHQLKLMAYVGPCPEGMECRHLDGNAKNNNLSNLAWGTRDDNVEDQKLHGKTNAGRIFGSGHSYKLRCRIKELMELASQGKYTASDLGRIFGVHYATILYHLKKNGIPLKRKRVKR